MIDARRKRSPIPAVETLEGRSLLSGAGLGRLAEFRSALVGRPDPSAIKTDPGAVNAITSALGGGIGSEWATLIRRQVRNPQSII